MIKNYLFFLKCLKVKTWFQNRRMKHKKLQKKPNEDGEETNCDESRETRSDDEESRDSFTSGDGSEKAQCSIKGGNSDSSAPSGSALYKPYQMERRIDEHEEEIDVVDSESEG